MKKKTLHPIMIALLALFVLLQAFCLTVFGAEYTEVCIPAGTDTEIVNQILTDTLLPDSEDTLKWEYECVGEEDGGLLKNTAWGSVGGFESTTKKSLLTPISIRRWQTMRMVNIRYAQERKNSQSEKQQNLPWIANCSGIRKFR